jgi:hypothetical protein
MCVLAGASPAAAQPKGRNPVALLIEKSGAIDPDLQAYSEIMAGTKIAVPKGSSIVFIDYHSCDRVTASGTSLDFSEAGFSADGTSGLSKERIACPQTIAPDGGGENSSVLIRGLIVEHSARIALRPTFVVVGGSERGLTRISVTSGAASVLIAYLSGRRFDWPASAPPLDPGNVYQVALFSSATDDNPLRLSFRAADSASSIPALVLIHANR